jgi:uncharacterized protein involved in exopolysaccharide biosynthesis
VLGASRPLPVLERSAHYPRPTWAEAHLWDYWKVIAQHPWTVVTVCLGAVLATSIWIVTAPPVFTATAVLRIEREEPRVVKFDQVVRDDTQSESPEAPSSRSSAIGQVS